MTNRLIWRIFAVFLLSQPAMAVLGQVHLVVVDSKSGPNVPKDERHRPPDRVTVYLPDARPSKLLKMQSWANDVVPVLLRKQAGCPLEGHLAGWAPKA